MEPYEMFFSQCIDLINSYEFFIEFESHQVNSVIKKVGKFVQHCEEWNLFVEDVEVRLEREEES